MALIPMSSPFLPGRLGENSLHHSRRFQASPSLDPAPPLPEAPLRATSHPSSPSLHRLSYPPGPGDACAQPHSPASPVPAPPSPQWRRRLDKVAAAARWPARLEPSLLPLPPVTPPPPPPWLERCAVNRPRKSQSLSSSRLGAGLSRCQGG